MNKHKIRIEWDSKSANETSLILAEGLTQINSNLAEVTSFIVPISEDSCETLSLDTGITIALVNSSVALAISLISAIAQVIATKEKAKANQMEICLRDGTKIVLPVNADKKSIDKLFKGLKDVRAMEIDSMLISKIPGK
jgi:hypothetical protein